MTSDRKTIYVIMRFALRMLVLCVLAPTAHAQTTSFVDGKVSFAPE